MIRLRAICKTVKFYDEDVSWWVVEVYNMAISEIVLLYN